MVKKSKGRAGELLNLTEKGKRFKEYEKARQLWTGLAPALILFFLLFVFYIFYRANN
jgi:hypothetical protein